MDLWRHPKEATSGSREWSSNRPGACYREGVGLKRWEAHPWVSNVSGAPTTTVLGNACSGGQTMAEVPEQDQDPSVDG